MLMFMRDGFDPVLFVSFVVVAFFAFAYHEFGHAWMADYLGDPTPRRNGRLTLNPIPHIDPMGMVLLILFGFGWASTPINPYALRGNIRTSHALVSIAGPAVNLLMAIVYGLALRLFLWTDPDPSTKSYHLWFTFLWIGVYLNLFLIAFNLLPIPPLDGFRVLQGVLPAELAYKMEALLPYSSLIFIILLVGGQYFGLTAILFPFIRIMFRILVGYSLAG